MHEGIVVEVEDSTEGIITLIAARDFSQSSVINTQVIDSTCVDLK